MIISCLFSSGDFEFHLNVLGSSLGTDLSVSLIVTGTSLDNVLGVICVIDLLLSMGNLSVFWIGSDSGMDLSHQVFN